MKGGVALLGIFLVLFGSTVPSHAASGDVVPFRESLASCVRRSMDFMNPSKRGLRAHLRAAMRVFGMEEVPTSSAELRVAKMQEYRLSDPEVLTNVGWRKAQLEKALAEFEAMLDESQWVLDARSGIRLPPDFRARGWLVAEGTAPSFGPLFKSRMGDRVRAIREAIALGDQAIRDGSISYYDQVRMGEIYALADWTRFQGVLSMKYQPTDEALRGTMAYLVDSFPYRLAIYTPRSLSVVQMNGLWESGVVPMGEVAWGERVDADGDAYTSSGLTGHDRAHGFVQTSDHVLLGRKAREQGTPVGRTAFRFMLRELGRAERMYERFERFVAAEPDARVRQLFHLFWFELDHERFSANDRVYTDPLAAAATALRKFSRDRIDRPRVPGKLLAQGFRVRAEGGYYDAETNEAILQSTTPQIRLALERFTVFLRSYGGEP